MAVPYKINWRTKLNPAIPLLWYNPKEIKVGTGCGGTGGRSIKGMFATQRIWAHLKKIKVKGLKWRLNIYSCLLFTIVKGQASICRLTRKETDTCHVMDKPDDITTWSTVGTEGQIPHHCTQCVHVEYSVSHWQVGKTADVGSYYYCLWGTESSLERWKLFFRWMCQQLGNCNYTAWLK